MRKAMLAGSAVLGLLVLLWVVAGAVVWSRNSYIPPSIPARKPFPANNAYADYMTAVRNLKSVGEVSKLFDDPNAAPAALQRVLLVNAPVLSSVHAASANPSVVTDLEPKKDFVAAIDFPNVTRLLALEARARTARSPSTAFEPMLDGVYFAEGVMRGGAMLHVLTGYLAYTPIFQASPDLIKKLPAGSARQSAEVLRKVLNSDVSLEEIVRNEHAVRFRQLTSVLPQPARVFKLDIPWDGYEREFTLKPKAPAVEGLNRYFEAWRAQATLPITQVTPPDGPHGMEGILNDDSMGPEEMGKRFHQFFWRDARLRMLYTSLQLEHHRKAKGRYPASLSEIGKDPLFNDPFSGKSLIYRRTGSDFTLYSVGPNQTDDGGAPLNEARLDPKQSGDLPLTPTFGRR